MTYWKKATPLSWGLGMTKDENPIYGDNRCLIIVVMAVAMAEEAI